MELSGRLVFRLRSRRWDVHAGDVARAGPRHSEGLEEVVLHTAGGGGGLPLHSTTADPQAPPGG